MRRTFLMLAAASLFVVSAPALGHAAPESRRGSPTSEPPCAKVDLVYTPLHIHPGDGMDMDLTIWNCSTVDEHLILAVKRNGPCPFPRPAAHAYDLRAGVALQISALVIGPSCPGEYRVAVGVSAFGRTLDTDKGGFWVDDPVA